MSQITLSKIVFITNPGLKSAESTTVTTSCQEGWDKHSIGGEDYCFRNIGEYSPAEAENECMARGTNLPLPTSSAQNEDLRVLVETVWNVAYIIIGISDSG